MPESLTVVVLGSPGRAAMEGHLYRCPNLPSVVTITFPSVLPQWRGIFIDARMCVVSSLALTPAEPQWRGIFIDARIPHLEAGIMQPGVPQWRGIFIDARMDGSRMDRPRRGTRRNGGASL